MLNLTDTLELCPLNPSIREEDKEKRGPIFNTAQISTQLEGGRGGEGSRERRREGEEGGMERGRERWRERGGRGREREGEREGRREGGREGGREGEGGIEGGREGGELRQEWGEERVDIYMKQEVKQGRPYFRGVLISGGPYLIELCFGYITAYTRNSESEL